MNVCQQNEHILFTCSACLTKLMTFFRVLETWFHCDFRKMEVLKVNKPIALKHRPSSSHCKELLFF